VRSFNTDLTLTITATAGEPDPSTFIGPDYEWRGNNAPVNITDAVLAFSRESFTATFNLTLPTWMIGNYVQLMIATSDVADDPALARLFDAGLRGFDDAKAIANLVINDVAALRKSGEFKADGVQIGRVAELLDLGVITSRIARNLVAVLATEGGDAAAIVKARGWVAVHDRGRIEAQAREVLSSHPNEVAAYCGGKTSLLGFFVGKVMKATGGTAQPQLVQEIVRGMLEG